MIKITLPAKFTGVRAGVQFADGVANVTKIGDSQRRYFSAAGAKIVDPKPTPVKPKA